MSKILKFRTDGGEVLIETRPPPGEVVPVGRLDDAIEAVDARLDKAFELVRNIAMSFRTAVDPELVSGAELELGLQFTGKGTIYVVEAEAQASLKVTLKFGGG